MLGGQEGLVELVLGFRASDGELRMRSRSERSNYLKAGRLRRVGAGGRTGPRAG